MKNEDTCPCKSGKTFGECCGPIIAGTARAETAEALMRARYASYVTGDVDFLRSSATKEVQKEFDEATSKAWSEAARWHGLEILRTERGGHGDTDGVVEFRALYTANGEFCNHHEVSKFVREQDGWKFSDGDLVKEKPEVREGPKIGRNDLCPCGSGRKYKKCCGRGKV
ncbi:MAG: YchJ family protein [Kiritimatiellae bacterium]|nr:YchJ family protein [Kiritimatiellia bacterium]MBQ3342198.1 YchJ family protein [Kiritimatiellia bacterium]MBQ6329000.1 YchJ family protein [Kiritimatiellia bacterium]